MPAPEEIPIHADWWPARLAHLRDADPWETDPVLVAEIRSFDERPHAGQRTAFCALVPMGDLDSVMSNLGGLDHGISTSGPHPSPSVDREYRPLFSIRGDGLPRSSYEPLILSWSSHNQTVLLPDAGFLMTYGLSQRALRNGIVSWDDPAKPVFDVVKVGPPSTWDYPLATSTSVTIARPYLQDYLSLRNMALVQVYWEQRYAVSDAELEGLLGKEDEIDLSFPDRRVILHRIMGGQSVISIQVFGARLVATSGQFPVSENPLETNGLLWPGFVDPVTCDVASHLGAHDCVFVDDSVLAKFEGKPGYRITPETGGVSFGHQWSVGHCSRFGRNLIRLELKKLYEGAPAPIVRHWHAFAVPPVTEAAYPIVRNERHIAARAKELVYSVVLLGEAIAALDAKAGGNRLSEDFVGLKRTALDYYGWWNFPKTEPLSWHVPRNIAVDAFLNRCVKLQQLVVEGLGEAVLRRLLVAIGVPEAELYVEGRPLRALKLLDFLIRIAQVARKIGVPLVGHALPCCESLRTEGTSPAQPIGLLFALHDIRLLQAHGSGDRDGKLSAELERFGIPPGAEAAGFGTILDHIYDALIEQLTIGSTTISATEV